MPVMSAPPTATIALPVPPQPTMLAPQPPIMMMPAPPMPPMRPPPLMSKYRINLNNYIRQQLLSIDIVCTNIVGNEFRIF